MAENSTLGALQQQASGELTTADVVQDGTALAVTPLGAGLQGRGPASLKMAGTQPAKVNALRTAMQESRSQMLASLREREAGTMTAAEQARVSAVKSASPLTKVDEVLAKKVETNTKAALNSLKFEGAQLDTDKLPTGYDTVTLVNSLGDLISGGSGLDDADIKVINDALKKMNPKNPLISYAADKQMDAVVIANAIKPLFKDKTKEELFGVVQKAITDTKSQAAIGSLTDQDAKDILGNPNATADDLTKLLAGVTGKSPTDIQGMQLGELREAIASWSKSEFQDISNLRKILNNPLSSPAQSQLALEKLRRLGQIEVTAYENKVNDLEKQMQDGDKVRIGDEEFTIEELFKDPAKVLQMQTLIDNPDLLEGDAAIGLSGFKTFLTANRDAIATEVNKIIGGGDTGLVGAIKQIETNAAALKVAPGAAVLADSTIEAFFPGFTDVGIVSKIPAQSTQEMVDAMPAGPAKDKAQADLNNYNKYKLLQEPTGKTAENTALLMNRLLGLTELDGKKVFQELAVDEIRALAASSVRVEEFITSLKHRSAASSFKGTTNFANEFTDFLNNVGMGPTKTAFDGLMSTDLTPYYDIFAAAGLSDLLVQTNPNYRPGPATLTEILGRPLGTGAKYKLNTDKLASLVKGLGSLTTAQLLNGDAIKQLNQFQNIIDTLRQQGSKPPLKPVERTAADEANFRRSNPLLHPDDLIRDLDAKVSQAETALQKASQAAQTAKAAFPEPSPGEWTYDSRGVGRFVTNPEWLNWKQKMNELDQPVRDAEVLLNDARNKSVDAKNNRPQQLVTYNDKLKTWNEGQAGLVADNNAALQRTYDSFLALIKEVK